MAGQREHCLTSCSEPQSIQLVTRCTPVSAPSSWLRPERIFSLVTKLNSQDIEQTKGKSSSSFYMGDPQQGLSKQTLVWWGMNSTVCEASSNNSRLLMGLCLLFFSIVLPPYDKRHNTEKQRKIITISGRKGSIKIKSVHLPNSRVTMTQASRFTNIISR